MFDMKACGARIKELRKKNNETQETMACNLYISQDHIRKIESGKSGASIDLLIDISQLLDVSTDYLLKGTPVISSDARVRMLSALTELTAIINEL